MREAFKPSGTVQSINRALNLLNIVSKSPEGLSLKEVAQQTDLPTSTAHRLLYTLSEASFVQVNPETQRWQVGVQAFSVGQGFLHGRDLIKIARGPMLKLMQETQETVKIGILSYNQVMILMQAECSQPMRAFVEPGTNLPLHCTALGKALLTNLSKPEAMAIVDPFMSAQTARTLPNFNALWHQVELARKKGYSLQDEEYSVGLRGAAACIYNEAGQAIAALGVTGPCVRVPSDRLEQLGALSAQVCAEITQLYGGNMPQSVAA